MDDDLDDATERVVVGDRLVDAGDHRLGRRRVRAAHRGRIDAFEFIRSGGGGVLRDAHASDVDDVADDADADRVEQLRRERARDDARRGLTRRGTLQRVTDVIEPVLQRADEVGVTGPGPGEPTATAGCAHGVEVGARLGIHRLAPLGPLGVVDEHGDGAAERATVADSTDDLDAVDLEVHAGRATVAVATARELDVEHGGGDGQAGREPLHGRDERRTVGLPGGQQSQAHVPTVLSGVVSVTATDA